MSAPALILFAHGARDPRWAAPFERILERVRARVPERSPMLAYLEVMTPDLATAIEAQVRAGFSTIRIVPLFLGPGGHLRSDIPRLVDEARRLHPGLRIDVGAPAGEDSRVIEAIAALCAD
jgi:sirohydrochlorin cobaltochelatase